MIRRPSVLAALLCGLLFVPPLRADDAFDALVQSAEDADRSENWAEAARLYERVLSGATKNWGKNSLKEATNAARLARVYDRLNTIDKAETMYRRAIRIRDANDDRIGTATAAKNFGQMLVNRERYRTAIEPLERAVAIYQKEFSAESTELADASFVLARAALEAGDFGKATAALERAAAIRTKILDASDPLLADTLYQQGRLYASRGEHPKSIEYYARCRALRETQGAGPAQLAVVDLMLGYGHKMQRKYDRAEFHYRRALDLYRPIDVYGTSDAYANLFYLFLYQSQYARAEAVLGELRNHCQTSIPATDWRHAWCEIYAGEYARAIGRHADAERAFRRAIELHRGVNGGKSIHSTYQIHLQLAELYRKTGRAKEADAEYRTVLAEYERFHGRDHPDVGARLWDYSLFLIENRRYDEARTLLDRALVIWDKPECKCHL